MNERLKGTGVALVTPFGNDGRIDFDALERVLEHVSTGGVDYLVPLGTTAETPTLSKVERADILKYVKSNNPKNLPIILGKGSNCTAELIDSLPDTDFDGIDAILSVVPYYNRPTQQGLIAHFSALADKSPVPIILYNVPSRTASNLEAATTISLAAHPNIIGIKEASGNLEQCAIIASQAPTGFLLISGDDMITLPLLSLGGAGVISVIANAFPRQISEIVSEYLSGKTNETARHFHQLVKMIQLIFLEGSPVGVKEAMRQLGICPNSVRLPLVSSSESLATRIREEIEKIRQIKKVDKTTFMLKKFL
ncbi:MAG: 4-hydroxy-tetrahydrodipicolinate synthase [Bacteroidetes bacterium]|nr:4-hydroxy-tetrahydrodipicolinate synthase [Bacteroidota bacterium]MDA1120010.1 4-hydroxy-tetrahydrodipicolinate synthase [Bacteroidota bacterium]